MLSLSAIIKRFSSLISFCHNNKILYNEQCYIYLVGDVSNILLNLPEDDFKKRYGRHKPTKDTKIIFSCRSGKRSGMVQEAVQKLGYNKYVDVFYKY